MSGDPLAVTLSVKFPPVHIAPPKGWAVMLMSGVIITVAVVLTAWPHPLCEALANPLEYADPATALEGVYVDVVASTPGAFVHGPPTAAADCHWYVIVPDPPVTVTVIWSVPPIHSLIFTGCVVT